MDVSIQHTSGRTVYCVIFGLTSAAFWRPGSGAFDSATYNATNHKIAMTEAAVGSLTTIGMYRVSGGVSYAVSAFSERILVMIFDDAESPALLGAEQTEVANGYEIVKVSKDTPGGVGLVSDSSGNLTVKISTGVGAGQLSITSGVVAASIGTGGITASSFAAGAITSTTFASGAITAGTFAAGAIDAAAIATDAIGSNELAAGAVTKIVAGITTTYGATFANLDTTVSSRLASGSYTSPPSAATIAAAVWDYLSAAATTANSLGKRIVDYLNAAVGSVPTAVLDQTLSGHTTGGTVGGALANADVATSTRLAAASYTAPPTVQEIAEGVLSLDVADVEAAASVNSLCFLVLASRQSNLPSAGSTWTVYQTDGVSTFDTLAIGRATDGTVESIAG